MSWPESRPAEYDSAAFWNETAGTWTGIDTGGSHYKCQMVVIGSDDSGNGVVYYGVV